MYGRRIVCPIGNIEEGIVPHRKARDALPSKRDRQRQGAKRAIGIFGRRRLYLLVVKRRYAA